MSSRPGLEGASSIVQPPMPGIVAGGASRRFPWRARSACPEATSPSPLARGLSSARAPARRHRAWPASVWPPSLPRAGRAACRRHSCGRGGARSSAGSPRRGACRSTARRPPRRAPRRGPGRRRPDPGRARIAGPISGSPAEAAGTRQFVVGAEREAHALDPRGRGGLRVGLGMEANRPGHAPGAHHHLLLAHPERPHERLPAAAPATPSRPRRQAAGRRGYDVLGDEWLSVRGGGCL